MAKKQTKKVYSLKTFAYTSDKSLIIKINTLLVLVIFLCSIMLATKITQKIRDSSLNSSEIEKKALVTAKQSQQVLASSTSRLPILMYHYVEEVRDINDTIRISLNIPPDIFEAQVTSLQRKGYTFLTMSEVSSFMHGAKAFPEKPIVLTFDDGYLDFYEVVFPLLKKYNIKSVAYVSPGLLDKPNYMSREQVIEIAKSGMVEIASHTVNHLHLQGSDLAHVYYEVKESKHMLEEMIGKEVISFAYPYGAFDEQAIQEVKKAGYQTAVSTLPGIDMTDENTFFLNRIRPGRRVGEELVNYLQGTAFTAY